MPSDFAGSGNVVPLKEVARDADKPPTLKFGLEHGGGGGDSGGMGGLAARVDALDKRMDRFDGRLDKIDDRLRGIDAGMAALNAKMDIMTTQIVAKVPNSWSMLGVMLGAATGLLALLGAAIGLARHFGLLP